MAYARPKFFTSWSFSRWKDHNQCPLRAKLKHLDKLPEPPSPPMERGAAIAKQEEDYFLGKVRLMPKDIHANVVPLFKELKKQKTLFAEQMWGFDKDWNEVAWNDWGNCWVRIKIDVGYTDIKANQLVIKDNKTGKYRDDQNEEYMFQLELYAAGGVSKHETVKSVSTQLIYTDLGIVYPMKKPLEYTREQALKARDGWDKRVKPMFADRRFAPKPGFYCRWCPYSKAKGGPCKF